MMGVLVRVVEDFHRAWLQGFVDLCKELWLITYGFKDGYTARVKCYLGPDRILHWRLGSRHGRQRPSQR